jgi:OFA family oxalate/formate antiporter-like MFS transporter
MRISDEARRWLIVAVMAFINFACAGSLSNTVGIFINPLIREFGASHTQTGALYTVQLLTSAATMPLCGWLLDRQDPRWPIAGGSVLAIVGVLLAASASSMLIIDLAYALMGVGGALSCLIPAAVLVANWIEDRRGLALGIIMCGLALGSATMALVSSYVVIHMGWRAAYLVLAVPIAFVIPLVLLIVRERPSLLLGRQSADPKPGAQLPGLEVAIAIRGRSFWLISTAYFAYIFSSTLVITHLVPYLIGRGIVPERAALILSLFLSCMAIGKFVLGSVADRFRANAVLAGAYCLTALGVVVLLYSSPLVGGIACALISGLTIGAAAPLTPIVAADAFGLRRFGTLSGLYMTIGIALGAMGPVGAGRLIDIYGGYTQAYLMVATVMLVTASFPLGCASYPATAEREIAAAAG